MAGVGDDETGLTGAKRIGSARNGTHQIWPLRHTEITAILIVGCDPSGFPPPIPSVGPVVPTWRIGSTMESSAGSLFQDSSEHPRDLVRPAGALDRSASAELRETISRTLSRGPAILVIDLSAVSGIDATGLAALVYACRAAAAAHVKLVLSAPSPLVQELLEPARLSDLCDVDPASAMTVPLRGTAA
jgi:anti-sigma B factor antagonist